MGGARLEGMSQPPPDFPLPECLPHRLLLHPPPTSQGGEGKGRWTAADAIGGGTDASLCGSSKTEQRSAGLGPPGLQLRGSRLGSIAEFQLPLFP